MAGESPRDLMEFAVGIAEEAGLITLRYFQGRYEVETKADLSVVTVADREAELHLRRAIEERFPADGILGEEFGEERAEAGRRWILDPVDGTYSFVHGVPLYGVLIGVEVGDEPSVGVVHLPALGETVAAARGAGCFWQGERARVSRTAGLGDSLVLTTEAHVADAVQAAALDRLVRSGGPARTWADCYGYALVASGRADVMVDPVMNVWDCAPLLPIIEEAGGRFTSWAGERTIRGGDGVASNGHLHNEVLAVLAG